MGWFYSITDEMIEWGLTGSELLVYALINNYSQMGQGCYWGSLDHTARVCGMSRKTAYRCLQSLVEKEFIKKSKAIINDNLAVIYTASRVSKCYHDAQNDTMGSVKMTPNIKDDIKEDIFIDKNNISYMPTKSSDNVSEASGRLRSRKQQEEKEEGTKKRFPFKKSLVALGVSEGLAEEWMFVRRQRKAVNTETAFKRIKKEFELSGLSPNECVKIAVEKSWTGFEAAWVKPTNSKYPNQQKKESVFEHNLKVMDEMYGTNLHAQAYGKKEVHHE